MERRSARNGALRPGAPARWPGEIVEQYPTLSLSNVYAVISCALDHRKSVDEYVAQRRQGTDALRAEIEKRWPAHGLRDRLVARRKKASPG